MEYTRLGRTGLKVSRIALGTMNFGPFVVEPDAHALMDRALSDGINFFDTANSYGRVKGQGVTEQIIGRWFAQGDGRRDKVVLATKVFAPMGDWPNQGKLSALHIRQSAEASLRRLQTDHIDLFQMHHIDRETPWEEVWQAMENLVTSGKVIYVGSSNFAGWHIAQANEIAKNRHFMGLVSEQSLYNLTKRAIETDVIPASQNYGVGILPWAPLSSGLLGGILEKESLGRSAAEGVQKDLARLRPQIEKYEAFCKEINQKPGDVAIAWLLAQPAVTAPIIGPRTVEQYESGLRALDLKLTPENLKSLDEIWPGPGGPAPEAYAW